MKYSQLFGKTLRETSQVYRAKSHALLIQGGFIRPLSQGLFSILPMGIRVMQKIKTIVREEMDAIGGQEVEVPLVNPIDIWKKTGRSYFIGKDMIRFRDRTGKEMVLSPTHEEAMVELSQLSLKSYRDLPVFLYQFQTKFRDEDKVRCGLVRAKEFLMSDGYSFHRSYSDLNNFFPRIYAAYQRIFERCNLEFITAEAGVGYIGGQKAYEFLMPVEYGDDIVIVCDNCGYKANKDIAVGIKDYTSGEPLPLEKVETPDCVSMDDLSAFLKLPKTRLAKTMVYKVKGGFAMAVVRGDYDVSVEKLSLLLDLPVVRLAREEELHSFGLNPGYLSPLGLDVDFPVIFDDTVVNSPNLVFGGNEENHHFINVNADRDLKPDQVGDIAGIQADNRCIQCGSMLHEVRAMELGNIFKLGDKYSKEMSLEFMDDNDKMLYPSMGAYGIGMGRLMAAIVEANSDDKGMVWPAHLAPYTVFLMGIGKSLSVNRVVDRIYNLMPETILCDDRKESLGVKFNDADLIGIPLRIVVSAKHLANDEVEFHDRKTGETWIVPIDNVAEMLKVWR